MSDAGVSSDPEEREAERILTGLSRGRFGGIEPARIARHVLASQEGDWAIRRAAFDALVRRYNFAQRDGLRVAEVPAQGGVLGVYRTSSQPRGSNSASKASGAARPYETALYSLAPLSTSCSCPDFVRSSLGLCKHGLVVLELLDRGAAGANAVALNPAVMNGSVASGPAPTLRWSFAQPLYGPFDRLLRLRLEREPPALALHGFSQAGTPDPRLLSDPPERLVWISALEDALRLGQLHAEPAVATVLAEERARSALWQKLSPYHEAAITQLSSLKRSLYPYQLEGVQRAVARGRLLLADDMGLGKTTQAIAVCHALLSAGAIERALLIVPTPLKSQWLREWQSTSPVPVTAVDGTPAERKRLYLNAQQSVLIIGYEQLLRDLEHVQAFGAQLAVLDEAQRIKNWATKSASYVKSLDATYRLVLTGTPLENRFDELASIMDFVDDLALEPKWRLQPFHSVLPTQDGVGGGAQHLAVLRERLSGAMLRRTRREVLSQLPARTDTRVPVEMTEPQRTRHDELRQAIGELLARADQRPLARGELLRLMQLLTAQRMVANGLAQVQFESEWPRCEHERPTPLLLESLFSPKLSVLRGLIEQLVIAQGRKVVAFSQWRKFLRLSEWAVRDVLEEHGLRAVFFTGAESTPARERALTEFCEDPAVSVLFASDAGGVGLNLQHATSCCINLELPWNPAVLEQRIGRIHRLGQTEPCEIYNLVTEASIEDRIAASLADKRALFSELLDGTRDSLTFRARTGLVSSAKRLVDPLPVPLSAAADSSDDVITSEPAAAQVQRSSARGSSAASKKPNALSRLGIQLTHLPDGSLRIEAPAKLAARVSLVLSRWAAKQ